MVSRRGLLGFGAVAVAGVAVGTYAMWDDIKILATPASAMRMDEPKTLRAAYNPNPMSMTTFERTARERDLAVLARNAGVAPLAETMMALTRFRPDANGRNLQLSFQSRNNDYLRIILSGDGDRPIIFEARGGNVIRLRDARDRLDNTGIRNQTIGAAYDSLREVIGNLEHNPTRLAEMRRKITDDRVVALRSAEQAPALRR